MERAAKRPGKKDISPTGPFLGEVRQDRGAAGWGIEAAWSRAGTQPFEADAHQAQLLISPHCPPFPSPHML